MDEKAKRIPFAIWEVDGVEYKLKLTTQAIIRLEEKTKTNLLNLVDDIPPLSIMLMVTHEAMKKYQHGIKANDVIEMFDKYCDDGGDQTTFMTEVFIPIYQASGFIPARQSEEMTKKLEEAKEELKE